MAVVGEERGALEDRCQRRLELTDLVAVKFLDPDAASAAQRQRRGVFAI